MLTEKNLTLFVHTTDSFDDCWYPFFKLLEIFWPDCGARIFLNTQNKDFFSETCEIHCTKIGTPGGADMRKNWSDRFLAGLEQVKTEYVLYVQEDYFLNAPVLSDKIEEYLQVFEHSDVKHINLMYGRKDGRLSQSHEHSDLFIIPQNASYRLCTQAGLWRKETLEKYTIPGESVWEWERRGTRRAQNSGEQFLCTDPWAVKHVFPYEPTGIVQGKWLERSVRELFKENNIEVDFSKRGFFRPTRLQERMQVVRSRIRNLLIKI